MLEFTMYVDVGLEEPVPCPVRIEADNIDYIVGIPPERQEDVGYACILYTLNMAELCLLETHQEVSKAIEDERIRSIWQKN